jgi:hypothetical protein
MGTISKYLLAASVGTCLCAWSGPEPGDIFREYVGLREGFFTACPPEGTLEHCSGIASRNISIDDLDQAVKAEVIVEFWGGHIGTSDQRFRVNGNDWVMMPTPVNTPTNKPYCYYRTIRGPAVSVPLETFRSGDNLFEFATGPQVCYGFDWPFMWIYDFIVRIYYDDSKEHPAGEITSPISSGSLGDSPEITARASSSNSSVAQVDFVGHFDGFDWGGDGLWEKWHYNLEHGAMKNHIGSASEEPYTVTWDNEWVADQEGMKIAAIITDNNGIKYMTPAVDNVALRHGRLVKMYRSEDIPERFGAYFWLERPSCNIIIDDGLDNALSAFIIASTWSGEHAQEWGFGNSQVGTHFGVVHDHSFEKHEVPLDILEQGGNSFYVYNTEQNHAAEINWPGPALFIRYDTQSTEVCSKGMPDISGFRIHREKAEGGLNIFVSETGSYTMNIADVNGRVLKTIKGSGPHTYRLNDAAEPGIYVIHMISRRVISSKQVVLF